MKFNGVDFNEVLKDLSRAKFLKECVGVWADNPDREKLLLEVYEKLGGTEKVKAVEKTESTDK